MNIVTQKEVNEYLITVGLTEKDYATLVQQELRRETVNRLATKFISLYGDEIIESVNTDELKVESAKVARERLIANLTRAMDETLRRTYGGEDEWD